MEQKSSLKETQMEIKHVEVDSTQEKKGNTHHTSTNNGREFKRCFTTEGSDPYNEVEWEYREATIANEKGEVLFKQTDIETPDFWSQMATNVVASKYFRGENGTTEREGSIKALISRVADTIKTWGMKDGYFKTTQDADIFHSELKHILLHQKAAFNSPVWFNCGVQEKPQCSACFILSVDDTMESLLELQRQEALLFKYGSGAGSNLSTIRSTKEKLSGGGQPSGPISFMKGFDAWAGIIKSGGKTRRAAKMQILDVEHPDIMEFITCKSNEEKKAWSLIDQGYDGNFAASGGAYEAIAFQNANLSVRVTDEFMKALKNNGTYWTKTVRDKQPCEEVNAKEIMDAMAEGTHVCGDPGIQFDTTINDWHTCPNSGRISASNPCSEYMHLDDSACNLASINLLKYLRDDCTFDHESFEHTVDVLITAQDILVDNSSYPTKKIAKCARNFRQLGLGYANLGAFLMSIGVPYDSDEGRDWAGVITAIMTGQAYKSSSVLAEKLAPFNGYKKNSKPMIKVIDMHRKATESLKSDYIPSNLTERAKQVWREALTHGKKYGYRNSQATVLAPTGTIAFMMDCDTTGVEPDIALVKYKKLVGGGLLKIVNNSVTRALKKLSYSDDEIKTIIAYIDEFDTIEGCSIVKSEHLPVFDCAFQAANGTRSIHYMGHLKMMAAAQPFISGAISKTVNLPNEATVEEIASVYTQAWEMGIKAVALYRDGSKRTQALSTSLDDDNKDTTSEFRPTRRRLPDEREAITHKFNVGGLEGYLTVGLYEDRTPGEIFLVVAKEGSTLSGVMDAFATSISMALQYGVPLATLAKKFSHMRFEPSGFTQNSDIPMAKSVVDYVFKWLASKFLPARQQAELGLKIATKTNEDKVVHPHTITSKAATQKTTKVNHNGNGHKQLDEADQLIMSTFHNSEDAPPCTSCGSSMMVRQGSCYRCLNCGTQGGCG